jgi:FAD-dependent urate hydroxylase
MASEKSTVLISGAGIAGPLLALQLLHYPSLAARFHPVLIDRLPLPPSPDAFKTSDASYAMGAGIILSCNALHSIYALGLKESFNAISAEGMTNEIWRADKTDQSKPGRFLNKLVSPAWMEDVDTGLRSVERARAQSLLVHAYLTKGGEARWGVKVTSVEQTASGVSVVLESGETIAGDLVVGADGTWSAVRKTILDGDDARWKPKFQNTSGIFGICSRPEGEEDEVLLGKGHVVFTNSGTVSTWALPDGRMFFTAVTNETSAPTAKSSTVDMEGYNAPLHTGGYSVESSIAILKRYETVWHPVTGTFGTIFKDAERMGRIALYQRVWEENEIQRWGNTVVIGDAARSMVPASGQGACFAIEDATVLADALLNNPPTVDAATGKKDFDKALKEYASQRVPRSKKIATQSYWSLVVSQGDRWWSGWLRDFATAWIKMDTDNRE